MTQNGLKIVVTVCCVSIGFGCARPEPAGVEPVGLVETETPVPVRRNVFDGETLLVEEIASGEKFEGPGRFLLKASESIRTGKPLAVSVRDTDQVLPSCKPDRFHTTRAESYLRHVIHEDTFLRVIKVDTEPGEQSGWLFFDDLGFVYIDRPTTLRFTFLESQGGFTTNVDAHHWNGGEPPHSVEVTGSTPLSVFRFEVKQCDNREH